jgi:DNA replication protein DnaC
VKRKIDKTDPEFWRDVLQSKCSLCNGTGIVSVEDDGNAVKLCKCTRMVKLFAKMNDPVHGLHPKYHKWSLTNAANLSSQTKKNIVNYFKIVGKANPYKNLIIKGEQGSGKSSIVSIIYKFLMIREYNISIFRFSEIASLSRVYLSNSAEFNNRMELYNLLRDEDFIIIEDVDSRGHNTDPNFERLGYGLFDDIFSYRANHPKKSTIISIDSNIKLTPSTLGRSFYNSIYLSDVEDNEIYEIEIV